MTALKLRWLLIPLLALPRCAHVEPTGDEHRAAAAADMAASEEARAKYDPEHRALETVPPTHAQADDPTPPPRIYNPTAIHLAEADRRMTSAFKHLEAAQKLEKFEDAACTGISDAERTSCPLVAPHVQTIEETARGVTLHIRTAEKAKPLSIQMRCHLAFAQANNFEKVPCPLYMKGVSITLVGTQTIEITSSDPKVVRAIIGESRLMFGEPPANVSMK